VELHAHIANNSIFNNIKAEDLWSNIAPLNVRYLNVKVLSKEMLILHAFWHTYLNLTSSASIRMLWLIDLVYLLSDDPESTDWEFLERKTVGAGIHKPGYFCLELVRQLFGIPLKANLFKSLVPKTYERKVFNAIMRRKRKPYGSIKKEIFLRMLLQFISLKNRATKLQYIKQVLFSEKI
jgi:hypothetical protein